jgi:hypothetical protein
LAGVAFFLVWALMMLAMLGSYAVGLVAIISIGRAPAEAFGPWWDNTKSAWMIGVALSFLIPFGGWVSGIFWLTSGRRPLRRTGAAGRPFWAGPPRPAPPYYYPPFPPPPPTA